MLVADQTQASTSSRHLSELQTESLVKALESTKPVPTNAGALDDQSISTSSTPKAKRVLPFDPEDTLVS